MKTLPADLAEQLRQETHTVTHLFELALKSTHTYYWTQFEKPIFYSSQWYEPRGVSFGSIQMSMLPRADVVSLEIQNVDKRFSTLAIGTEIRGKAVTIREVALSKNNSVIAGYVAFYGFVDAMTINQRTAVVEVYNHMIQWRRATPRRIHSATCPWVFKDVASQVIGTDAQNYTCILDHPATSDDKPITGANYLTYWSQVGSSGVAWVTGTQYSAGTCRYAGAETWCDLSWDRCLALSNTDNFGGFRWLPGIVNKDIWWGRAPAKGGTK